MIYMPENFYKHEMLDKKLLTKRYNENELVSFLVSGWDSEKRALVVYFKDGITGYIPEDEVCIETLKYNFTYFDYPLQANSIIGKIACALITDINGDEVILSRKKLQEIALQALSIGEIYEVYIKSVKSIGLFVDVGVGISGFIHKTEISKTQFNSIDDFKKDFGLYRGRAIPAKLICLEENVKLSFRRLFNFPVISRGDFVYGTVRNPLPDATGYFVDLSPNDTAIVDADKNLKLCYGSKIIVQIRSSETVCEDSNYYTRHRVIYVSG